jgi:uncharacterized protein Yka (UPF0111/DUF47 family)
MKKKKDSKEEISVIMSEIKAVENELDILENKLEDLKVIYEEATGENYNDYCPF